MKQDRSYRIAGVTAIVVMSCCAIAMAQAGPAVGRFNNDVKPLLAKYCYDCHGGGMDKGNIAFDELKTDPAILDHDLWFKAIKNLRGGIMPPAGEDRPTADEMKVIENWIKRDAFGIDPKNPDPGRVTIRRLNRAEYHNTIRDLMGVDYKVEEEFPPDDTGYGFDNIGDVLSVSPMLLEKYMQAAETVVAQAVPPVSKVVAETTISGLDFMKGTGPIPDRTTLKKEAHFSQTAKITEAGDYRIVVQFSLHGTFDFAPERATLALRVDDEAPLLKEEYGWQDNKKYEYTFARKWEPGERKFSFDLVPVAPPATQEAAVTTQPEQQPPPRAFSVPRNTNVDLRIIAVRIEGPLDPSKWVAPGNYSKFFSRPEPPTQEPARREYAKEVMTRFATRAYRRPVDDRSVERLVALAESVYTQPGKRFEHGIAQAIVAVLSSPRFIFRMEQTAPAGSDTFAPVDEYALASRLSYFLWSSMPDGELSWLAQRGELRKNLDAQVKRMLADARAQAFVSNFVGQWLQARDVEAVPIEARIVLARDAGQEAQLKADELAFARGNRGQANQNRANQDQANPNQQQTIAAGARGARGARGNRGNRASLAPAIELNGPLRQAMRREAEMAFDYVVHEDRPITELIDADYTFLNAPLAKHYGIDGITGNNMRKVELPKDSPRGGVLTEGAFLVVTSNSTRTSPVKRGQFILDNILGAPSPPPPANVPNLEESEKKIAGHEPTVRESLELHRDDALCKSCHGRMDPLGLALENFNAMGMWRDKERNQPIEPSGTLISGEKLSGARDLKQIIVNEKRLDYYRCLSEKLLTYALGRGLEYYDVETVDQIVQKLQDNDGRFSALLTGVIESAPFQKRRNSATPMAQVQQRDQHE